MLRFTYHTTLAAFLLAVLPAALPAAEVESGNQKAVLPPPDQISVETVTERYPSGNVKIERQVAMDVDLNFVNHGPFKMFDNSGNLVAQGEFVAGQRVGQWLRLHTAQESATFGQAPFSQFAGPFQSVATFRDGQLTGTWVITDSQDRRICEIAFQNGQRHGEFVLYHTDGSKLRQADFANGVIDGFDREFDAKGELVSERQYLAGRRIVVKTEEFVSTTKKSEGTFLYPTMVVGAADSWWTGTFATYGVEEGEPVRHGTFTKWHENGIKRTVGEFVHDKPVGEFVWWYETGQKAMHGVYVDGQQEGRWTWWHENGIKSIVGDYKAGKPVGVWNRWQPSGKLVSSNNVDKEPLVSTEDQSVPAAPAATPTNTAPTNAVPTNAVPSDLPVNELND